MFQAFLPIVFADNRVLKADITLDDIFHTHCFFIIDYTPRLDFNELSFVGRFSLDVMFM